MISRINTAIISYENLLTKYPIKTKAATAFFIFGLGDLLCQHMEIKYLKIKTKYELSRLLKGAAFGIIVAPYLHLQLSYIIPKLFQEGSKYFVLKSTAYAVLVSDSIFNFSYFLFMELSQNHKKSKYSNLNNEVMNKFIPTQIMNIKVWPFLTGFNFYFMPPQYRVLFDNFASIFWMCYLSFIENNTENKL
jgi:hypothetical protein